MPSCVLWSSLSAVLMNHFNDRYFFSSPHQMVRLIRGFQCRMAQVFSPEIILFPHILFFRQFMWRLTVVT